MNKEKELLQKRTRRRKKIRSKISGTAKYPRLSVFKSNVGMYLQLIDDDKKQTLVGVGIKEIKTKRKSKKTEDKSKELGSKVNDSFELGKLIAQKAQAKGIKKAVFDRGGYKYHGRVKAVAEGAREGGLKI